MNASGTTGTTQPLRYLLLQARDPGDPTRADEHACFASALNAQPEDVLSHDLLSGPPSLEHVNSHDVLLVGGSGKYSVLDKHLWVRRFIDFLGDVVVGHRVPTFASCFGFQGLVMAGGGTVVWDQPRAEVGTFTVYRTPAGATDPLLCDVPAQFKAQLGHTDRAARLPTGMVNLAYSDRAPYQALRIAGAPVVATQFHPELDRAANTLRYRRYLDLYRSKGVTGDGDDPVLASMADSPVASSLLLRFVDSLM